MKEHMTISLGQNEMFDCVGLFFGSRWVQMYLCLNFVIIVVFLLSFPELRNRIEGKQLSRSHGGSLPSTPKHAMSNDTRLCRSELKKRKAALAAVGKLTVEKNKWCHLPLTSMINMWNSVHL